MPRLGVNTASPGASACSTRRLFPRLFPSSRLLVMNLPQCIRLIYSKLVVASALFGKQVSIQIIWLGDMSSNTQRRWSARSLIYARQLIEYNGVIPSGDNEATNAETDQKRVNSKNSGTSSREATMVRALVSPAPLKRNRTSSSSSSSSPCRRMTAQRKRPQRGKAKASALPESANRQKRLRTSHLRRRGTSCTVAPYSPEAPCKPSSCADEDESHNDGGIIHGDAQLFHPSARTRKGNRRGLLEQRVVLQKVTNNDAAAMTATIPAATIAPALSLSGTTNALGRPRRRTKHLFMTQGNVSLQHTTTTPVTPPESDAAAVEALLQLGSSSLRVNRDARRLRGGHGEGLEVGEEEKKQGKATGGGGEDINIAMTTPRTNIPRETEIGNTAGISWEGGFCGNIVYPHCR